MLDAPLSESLAPDLTTEDVCDECDGTGEVFSRVVDGQTYVRICECVPPDEPDEGPVYGYRNRCARVRS